MSKNEGGATYKYSIKSDSGYKYDQTGKITLEHHAVVCYALDGALADNISLLTAAPDLLDALEGCLEALRAYSPECGQAMMAKAAIAKAKGESA